MEVEVRNLKHTQNARIEHPGKLGETPILGGAPRAHIPALLKTLLSGVGMTRLPLLFSITVLPRLTRKQVSPQTTGCRMPRLLFLQAGLCQNLPS